MAKINIKELSRKELVELRIKLDKQSIAVMRQIYKLDHKEYQDKDHLSKTSVRDRILLFLQCNRNGTSARDICAQINVDYSNTGRITELKASRDVIADGKMKCPITGQMVDRIRLKEDKGYIDLDLPEDDDEDDEEFLQSLTKENENEMLYGLDEDRQ